MVQAHDLILQQYRQQFSEALTNKAGSALKVTNKSIEEGVAVLSALADRGVKGAEAGEKLNQILRDIPRATAKNSDEFKKLSLEMFDSQGNMKNVADIVEQLDAVLGPMSDEMKAFRKSMRDIPQDFSEDKYDELLARNSEGNLTHSVWSKP